MGPIVTHTIVITVQVRQLRLRAKKPRVIGHVIEPLQACPPRPRTRILVANEQRCLPIAVHCQISVPLGSEDRACQRIGIQQFQILIAEGEVAAEIGQMFHIGIPEREDPQIPHLAILGFLFL